MFESPITNSKSKIINHFLAKDIIRGYKNVFNIDVEYIFKNVQIVYLCECPNTGLLFFYPFDIYGDGNFYKQLSKIEWYYIESKWEHQIALDWINPNSTVLEIGCGNGSFLKSLLKKNCKPVGLEILPERNPSNFGITILDQTIEEHSKYNEEVYDYVCGFQVFEHLPNLKNSILSAIKVLKPNGKLIISVPNQESFISLDEFNLLDMPPHHMTRWTPKVFNSIAKFFNLKLVDLKFEFLQPHHKEWFLNLISRLYKNEQIVTLFKEIAEKYPQRIRGHTIIGMFQKIS